jgi:hypothetical protein
MRTRPTWMRSAPLAFTLALVTACGGTVTTLPPDLPGPASPTTTPTETAPTRTRIPPPTPPVAGSEHVPVGGEMEPGTYHVYAGLWTPVTFTFEVAAEGWIAENGGQGASKLPNAADFSTEISWSVLVVEALFADPCGPNDPLPVGPSVEDFITALRGLPGPRASDPVDIVVDGYGGQYVDLVVPRDFDIDTCDPPGLGLQIWLDKPGGKYLVAQTHHVARVHVLDVDGQRFIVSANIGNNADPDHIAEFEAILDSIRFHP